MIAVLFGLPGSGKGTQASFIAQAFGLPHISTGDMLRAQTERGSVLGDEVRPIMEAGQLVPDDLMVRVIEKRLRQPDTEAGALLDGFPRTVPQAEALDSMLQRSGGRVDLVLYLDVPRDVVVERILQRAREEQRADDTAEAVQERLVEYESKTLPVLDFYSDHGAHLERIHGLGTIDVVRQRILAAVDRLREKRLGARA